ncbi:putative golgi reassembly stacking protein [Phaeomoniella chlamydospora]|uniref:Putative golgi reassembly stacking protein n=1 Tax=Phaeomoniella chlamydospora TaxID=158046 RepID=A0A0G2G126_PHACM|nr:putative golgi reassembly stacking protein [Phaeomoniella chlamydospora]
MFRALNSFISKLDADPNSAAARTKGGNDLNLDGSYGFQGSRTQTLSIPVSASSQSLGVSFQFSPLSTTQHIWHILNVPSPLSPAHQAGLLPHSDYILGSPSGTLRGESALGELIEDHINRNLVLWVYNSEFDVVREVKLIPRRGWGGEGALGAELGYGALHRLPIPLTEGVQAPGESLFEATSTTGSNRPSTEINNHPYNQVPLQSQLSQPQYLVPANLTSPPPPPMFSPNAPLPTTSPTPPSTTPARKKQTNRHHPPSAFDEYFKESEQKSKEQDHAPSSSKGGPGVPPPPPKVGASVPPPPSAVEANSADQNGDVDSNEHEKEDVDGDGEPGPAEEAE